MLFERITNTEIKQVFLINKKQIFKCSKNVITLSEINIDASNMICNNIAFWPVLFSLLNRL